MQSILEVIRRVKEEGKWVIAGRPVMVDGVESLTLRITEADRATIERALVRRQKARAASHAKRRKKQIENRKEP